MRAFFDNLLNPSAVADVQAFLRDRREKLERSLRAIVPSDMIAEAGLLDGRWIDEVTGNDGRFSLAEAELASDYATVKSLEERAVSRRDYESARWASERANTMADEDVLSFLSRKAVIPKYGFPVDVVELGTQRARQGQDSLEVLLQRDLTIAVSEFAPTSAVVANKKLWTSYGVKRVAEKAWPQKRYKRCLRHNVFLQWREGEPEPATPCGDTLNVFRYVIPSFGFVTAREGPAKPKGRPARVFTTRPYFAGSRTSNRATFKVPAMSPVLSITEASPGLMVVLCEGRRGEGFYICSECGAGFRKRQTPHKTPTGEICNGTLENVSLGHEFVTDVLQLQFHSRSEHGVEPVWFAYSLGYALLEGAAELLEVPPADLSATVAHSQEYPVPPIILYDNVPGGAGLVAHVQEGQVLRACLETAAGRVNGRCGCDERTTCYGCLRSYRNQFAHRHLQRGPAHRYLKEVLARLP